MSTAGEPNSPLDLFSDRWFNWFARYVQKYLGRKFSGVHVLNPENAKVPDDRAVILFCNHGAWWDALMMPLLATTMVTGRKPFAPIDATALEHYKFMKRIGMFGVEQTPRGAVHFLKTARELLARPRTSLWLTPQGEFQDPRQRPIEFKAGLAHLASDREAILIPIALEYPFWDESKPEVLISFGAQIDSKQMDEQPVGDWKVFLEQHLTATMDELAEAAMTRDPANFHTLIDGSAGTNVLYDSWRAIKAVLTGKTFSRRHRDIAN